MANALVELRDTINEALRMHQLNLELLEYLDVALKWLRENDIPIPNQKKFVMLLSKTSILLKEIYSSPILQDRTPNRRKFTDKRNRRGLDRALIREKGHDKKQLFFNIYM